MKKIAALLACHNRKEKTLSAINTLYKATKTAPKEIFVDVYLTDDGSKDGTKEAIKKNVSESDYLGR